MNIGLLTLATSNIHSYSVVSSRNKRTYCTAQGYAFIYHEIVDPSRPAAWTKIRLMQKYLNFYDWIFWTDADSVITNPLIRLEELIDESYDMIITSDANGINAGQFMLRSCRWAFTFLEEVWAQEDLIHHPWWEQAAIIRLHSQHSQHIKVVPQRAFNSYECNWQPGDFLIHFAGASQSVRDERIALYELLSRGVITRAEVNDRTEFPLLLNRLGLCGEAVEVGVSDGTFAEALRELWAGKRLHLVDAWRSLPDYRDISNVSDEEHERRYKRVIQRLRLPNSAVSIHRCLSQEAVSKFEDSSLDFVYLDANHSYQAVCADMTAWYTKVRPGGIMAGHDFVDGELPEGSFGVKRAVLEFAASYGVQVLVTREERWPSWYLFKP